MEVDRSPHITPLYNNTHPRHQQEEETNDSRMAEQQRETSRPRHTHPGFNVQIYDGFDFGFNKAQSSTNNSTRRMRAPKSMSDLQLQASKQEEQPQWNGLHSPVRRHLPGGFDEADYFIKRGGWKRRGIVFGVSNSEPAHESDEDCFDI